MVTEDCYHSSKMVTHVTLSPKHHQASSALSSFFLSSCIPTMCRPLFWAIVLDILKL